MLFYDEVLKKYESHFCFDDALSYLEERYCEVYETCALNSLIAFSWFYLFEGPAVSGKYENCESRLAPTIWKKYIDLGLQKKVEDPTFFFIAGYTLSMDGYYLGKSYEELGLILMRKCAEKASNPYLKIVSNHFLQNQHASRYIPLTNNVVCEQLFAGDSLVEKLFRDIFDSEGDTGTVRNH